MPFSCRSSASNEHRDSGGTVEHALICLCVFREDLERVAPLWWELTLPVLKLIGGDRLNPQVPPSCTPHLDCGCRTSAYTGQHGRRMPERACTNQRQNSVTCTASSCEAHVGVGWQATKPFHKRIWYSEMHAYALGAAMEGVHHVASNSSIFQMDFYHPNGAQLHSSFYPAIQDSFSRHCAYARMA